MAKPKVTEMRDCFFRGCGECDTPKEKMTELPRHRGQAVGISKFRCPTCGATVSDSRHAP